LELELSPYSLDTLKSNKKFFSANPIEFYDKDSKRAKKEKILLQSTFKQALKRNTKLYRVKDKSKEINENLGFFAISVGNIDVNGSKIPSAVLDYFILNNKFRKYICEPNQYTLGIELFREILTIINDLSNTIGIRYIILEPLYQEKNLIDFYTKYSTWMYLDIKELG
jgi:hypothetical protein